MENELRIYWNGGKVVELHSVACPYTSILVATEKMISEHKAAGRRIKFCSCTEGRQVNALTWESTVDGFRRSDGAAVLVRNKHLRKRWILRTSDGQEFMLPPRASFDHADALMGRLYGPRCDKPVGRSACVLHSGHVGASCVGPKIANPEAN